MGIISRLAQRLSTPGIRLPESDRRTIDLVRKDLAARAISADPITLKRLCHYSDNQYGALRSIIDRLHAANQKISRLVVDEAGNMPRGENLRKLPWEIIESCIEGSTLKLQGLRQKLAEEADMRNIAPPVTMPLPAPSFSPPRDVALMEFVLDHEHVKLTEVSYKQQATLTKLFRSLDHGVSKLREFGLHNVAIYRPCEDESGKWELTHATRTFGESEFDPRKGGVDPGQSDSTVAWIINNGKSNDFYDVDIYEPDTFLAAGLPYYPEKAETDRTNTRGSGRTLFIKIESKYGVEGVIQIHNRVKADEAAVEPESLLPRDPIQTGRILRLLKFYFAQEFIGKIEEIRGRTKIAESSGLSAVTQKLLSEGNVDIYKESDLEKLSRADKYLPTSHVEFLKLRDGRKVKVEVIITGSKSIKEYLGGGEQGTALSILGQDLRIVTGLATGINKDDAVNQYLSSATILLAARDPETNQLIGYVAAKPEKIGNEYNNIFIWGNFELGSHHHVGLGTALNSYAIKLGKKMIGARPWNSAYLDFRTWNPAAFKMTQRADVKAFPSPNDGGTGVDRKPTAAEIAIMAVVSQNYLGRTADVNTGVISGVKPAVNINWLGIPRIDNFFKSFVKIEAGHAIFTVAKLPRFFEWIAPIRELWIKTGIWLKLLPIVKIFFKEKIKTVDWEAYFEAYQVLLELRPYRNLLGRITELAEAAPGKKALDLGSGTGNLSVCLAESGCDVTSFDNSRAGIAIHKQRDLNAKAVELDLNNGRVPVEEHSVDIVTANNVLNYLSKEGRTNVYREARRVLRPGGIFVFSVLKKGFNPIAVLLDHMKDELREARKYYGLTKALGLVYQQYQRMFPRLKVVGEANKAILEGVESGSYVLFDALPLLEELIDNGFTEEQITIEKAYAGQDYLVKIKI